MVLRKFVNHVIISRYYIYCAFPRSEGFACYCVVIVASGTNYPFYNDIGSQYFFFFKTVSFVRRGLVLVYFADSYKFVIFFQNEKDILNVMPDPEWTFLMGKRIMGFRKW